MIFFVYLVDDKKKCTSSTNIETFVSDSSRRRRSSGERNTKAKKKIKINMNGWTPAKLQICLQDIYCSDVMCKFKVSHLGSNQLSMPARLNLPVFFSS